MAPGSRFGRPLVGLKTRPKAFCEGNQGRAGSTGAKECVPGAEKVFSGRSGEYLGSVGPLWWHMVKVGIFENPGGFDSPGEPLGSLNGSGEPFWAPFGGFENPPKGILRRKTR